MASGHRGGRLIVVWVLLVMLLELLLRLLLHVMVGRVERGVAVEEVGRGGVCGRRGVLAAFGRPTATLRKKKRRR